MKTDYPKRKYIFEIFSAVNRFYKFYRGYHYYGKLFTYLIIFISLLQPVIDRKIL